MASEPGGPRTGQFEPIPEEWQLSKIEDKVLFSKPPEGMDDDSEPLNAQFDYDRYRYELAKKFLAQFYPISEIPASFYDDQSTLSQTLLAQFASYPDEIVRARTKHPDWDIQSGTHYLLPYVDVDHVSPIACKMSKTDGNYHSLSEKKRENHPYNLVMQAAGHAVEQGVADECKVTFAITVLDAWDDQVWDSGRQGGGNGFNWHLTRLLERRGLTMRPEIELDELSRYFEDHCMSSVVPS